MRLAAFIPVGAPEDGMGPYHSVFIQILGILHRLFSIVGFYVVGYTLHLPCICRVYTSLPWPISCRVRVRLD